MYTGRRTSGGCNIGSLSVTRWGRSGHIMQRDLRSRITLHIADTLQHMMTYSLESTYLYGVDIILIAHECGNHI